VHSLRKKGSADCKDTSNSRDIIYRKYGGSNCKEDERTAIAPAIAKTAIDAGNCRNNNNQQERQEY
jgi:hypothetical protein